MLWASFYWSKNGISYTIKLQTGSGMEILLRSESYLRLYPYHLSFFRR